MYLKNKKSIIVLISILWYALFYVLSQGNQLIFADSISYIEASEYWYLSGKVHYMRPLLIAIIGGVPLLFGYSKIVVIKWVLFLNFWFWLGTIVLFFDILKKIFTEKLSFWMTLIFVFCVGNTIINFHYLTEPMFVFFLMLFLWFYQKFHLTQNYKFLSIALFVMILMVLIKPLSVVFTFLVLIFNVKTFFKNVLKPINLIQLLPVLLVLYHVVDMKKQYGDYTISFANSSVWYNYIGTRADCYQKNLPFVAFNNYRHTYFETLSMPQQNAEYLKDMKYQIQNNFPNLVRAFFYNLYENSIKSSLQVINLQNNIDFKYYDQIRFLLRFISKMQNMLLSMLGLISILNLLYFFKKQNKFIIFLCLFVMIYLFFTAFSSGEGDRFSMVIYPIYLVLFTIFIISNPLLNKLLIKKINK